MDKQKQELTKLFEYLGMAADEAQAMSAAFLTPEEGKEPMLPTDQILQSAIGYAKPHLKPVFQKELSPSFKGQYIGEAINKVIAMSDGKLSRKDFERIDENDDNLSRALEAFAGLNKSKPQDSDIAQKYNALLKQLEEKESEFKSQLEAVHGEYAEKENSQKVYDYVLSALGGITQPKDGKPGKKIPVDISHAAKSIIRDLSDMAKLKYDDSNKAVSAYDRENPELAFHVGGKPMKMDELIMERLKVNGWLQESNGGAGNPILRQGQHNPQPQPQANERFSLRNQIEAQTSASA